jgi:DNA polymerase III epsilon subunit-like protein
MTLFCLSFETTGLHSVKTSGLDGITEIACLKLNEKIDELDWFETLVHPSVTIPQEIEVLTGITNAMVKYATNEKTALIELLSFLTCTEKITLLAHNAKYDRLVLENACKRHDLTLPPIKWTCSLKLARARWNKKNCSLKKCIERLQSLGLCSVSPFHRAMGTAKACVTLYKYLISTNEFHSKVQDENETIPWDNEASACVAAAVCGNYFMDPVQRTGLCDACADALDYYYKHSSSFDNSAFLHAVQCIDVLTQTNAALTLLALSNSNNDPVVEVRETRRSAKKRKV